MSRKEQRRSPRKLAKIPASVSCAAVGFVANVGQGRTLNLCETGALIEMQEPLYPGEVCSFTLMFDYGRSVVLEGRVARVVEVNGVYHVGVAFRNVGPDEQYWLALQLAKSPAQ